MILEDQIKMRKLPPKINLTSQQIEFILLTVWEYYPEKLDYFIKLGSMIPTELFFRWVKYNRIDLLMNYYPNTIPSDTYRGLESYQVTNNLMMLQYLFDRSPPPDMRCILDTSARLPEPTIEKVRLAKKYGANQPGLDLAILTGNINIVKEFEHEPIMPEYFYDCVHPEIFIYFMDRIDLRFNIDGHSVVCMAINLGSHTLLEHLFTRLVEITPHHLAKCNDESMIQKMLDYMNYKRIKKNLLEELLLVQPHYQYRPGSLHVQSIKEHFYSLI